MDEKKAKKLAEKVEELIQKAKESGDLAAIAIPATGEEIRAFLKSMGREESTFKLQMHVMKCLPCLEDTFKEISVRHGGDPIADAGALSIKVFGECMALDLINENKEMSEALIMTLLKFAEITKLKERRQGSKVKLKKRLEDILDED